MISSRTLESADYSMCAAIVWWENLFSVLLYLHHGVSSDAVKETSANKTTLQGLQHQDQGLDHQEGYQVHKN